jgi:sugar/nucleoside kinase (ribokinase family)
VRAIGIGEPCIDVIHKADGHVYNEHGGISYSITAGGMLEDGIETVPIIGLSREDRPYFEKLFAELSNVDLSGFYQTAAPVRRVDIFYEDENNRWECSTQPIEPTPFAKIAPLLPAEGIHVNLISGDDITLDTLAKIRAAAPLARIHLDLHNIVMARMPDGKRVRGPMEDFLDWCSYADTVQLNEEEARVIDPSMPDISVLAQKILAGPTKALVISYAEKGLALFEKWRGETVEHFFPPRMTAVVDPTGSGDVFGATFLHAVLLGKNFSQATEAGIEMATRKVGAAGPGGLLKTRKMNEHVR